MRFVEFPDVQLQECQILYDGRTVRGQIVGLIKEQFGFIKMISIYAFDSSVKQNASFNKFVFFVHPDAICMSALP